VSLALLQISSSDFPDRNWLNRGKNTIFSSQIQGQDVYTIQKPVTGFSAWVSMIFGWDSDFGEDQIQCISVNSMTSPCWPYNCVDTMLNLAV
jgi:hypothetical protein